MIEIILKTKIKKIKSKFKTLQIIHIYVNYIYMYKKGCSNSCWKYKDIISTIVLILLNKSPDYGYNIQNTISDIFGYSPTLNGLIYRTLSFFEASDLVYSKWLMDKVSQPRRIYSITEQGRAFLKNRIVIINEQKDLLEKILKLYGGEKP